MYGLDPDTWEKFRTILRTRGESVSAWAIRNIKAEVQADSYHAKEKA